jgi:hypothetical protein
MQHRVSLAEIGVERGQRRQLAPDGVVGKLLRDELLPPCNHMGAGNFPELFRPMHACIRHKVCDVLLIGPSGVGIGEIGKPFELWGDRREGLKLVVGEAGRRGGTRDRDRGGRHGVSLTPEK